MSDNSNSVNRLRSSRDHLDGGMACVACALKAYYILVTAIGVVATEFAVKKVFIFLARSVLAMTASLYPIASYIVPKFSANWTTS
jgi:hypothetical protein